MSNVRLLVEIREGGVIKFSELRGHSFGLDYEMMSSNMHTVSDESEISFDFNRKFSDTVLRYAKTSYWIDEIEIINDSESRIPYVLKNDCETLFLDPGSELTVRKWTE